MSKVLIGIDKSKSFRVYLSITTTLVEEARVMHQTTPLATAALGRVLTAGGIMGNMLKNETDRLTLLFKGDGPAKQILVAAKGSGEVRGYISNPNVELPLNEKKKLDVGGALGMGELTVIKDAGLKEPYSGTVALVSGEIAEDLASYFFLSEQQKTSISLGVKVGREEKVLAAGGFLIQLLPDATEEAIEDLEKVLSEVKPITTLIEEAILASSGKSEEGILESLLAKIFENISSEHKVRSLEFKDTYWNCNCSKERMENALMTIGKEDLTEILEEDGQAELACQFCDSKYLFSKEDLEQMLSKLEGDK